MSNLKSYGGMSRLLIDESDDTCPFCSFRFETKRDRYVHLEKWGCPKMYAAMTVEAAPLCACGCGERVLLSRRNPKKFNKYIQGHNKRKKENIKMAHGRIVDEKVSNEKEALVSDKIRAFLTELYGEEEMLIVRNTTNGVVSIGFGDRGDMGGKAIERSKLPIVLTDEFPRETWIKSADFRRAVAKGWLVPVSRDEYEREMAQHRERIARLAALSESEEENSPPAPKAQSVFSDTPSDEPMIVDEDSAELRPASTDQRLKQFMEYERMFEHPEPPKTNTPPGVNVIGGSVSSRVIAFCEQVKQGSMTTTEAVKWIDNESKILTGEDLKYIIKNVSVNAIKRVAQMFLNDSD